jgi:hypothetical protein
MLLLGILEGREIHLINAINGVSWRKIVSYHTSLYTKIAHYT